MAKTCDGFSKLEVNPSPKFQLYVKLPFVVLVNCVAVPIQAVVAVKVGFGLANVAVVPVKSSVNPALEAAVKRSTKIVYVCPAVTAKTGSHCPPGQPNPVVPFAPRVGLQLHESSVPKHAVVVSNIAKS